MSRDRSAAGVPRSHLLAALVAGLVVAAMLGGGQIYTQEVERSYVNALAPQLFEQKNQGSALQAAAFSRSDLLPVYGSSEFDYFSGPFTGFEFFRGYQTGFQLFPVGRRGTTATIILQHLAGLGDQLNGRKVAICISPTFFFHEASTRRTYYEGNYSRLQASELVFRSPLTPEFRRILARRMLHHPTTLASDPILRITVAQLAGNAPLRPALLSLIQPLGLLQTRVLELQDHWASLQYIRSQPELSPNVPQQPERLDWPAVLERADREARQRANSNQFGFENQFWRDHGAELSRRQGHGSDSTYLKELHHASWPELTNLLEGLRQLGARPLLLSVPMKGAFYDYRGVSAKARSLYYQRLRSLVRPFGVPLLDFQEFENDPYFVTDDRSHPSQKGWAYYDQALDAFYHDALTLSGRANQRTSAVRGGPAPVMMPGAAVSR